MKTRVLILTAGAILLTAALCCLPFLQYSSQMYIKRSPNTFVGDEKYQTARAETEDVLSALEEQGMTGTIQEEVIGDVAFCIAVDYPCSISSVCCWKFMLSNSKRQSGKRT